MVGGAADDTDLGVPLTWQFSPQQTLGGKLITVVFPGLLEQSAEFRHGRSHNDNPGVPPLSPGTMSGIFIADVDPSHQSPRSVHDRHLPVIPLVQPAEPPPERGWIEGVAENPALPDPAEVLAGGIEGADVVVEEQNPYPASDSGGKGLGK